jgi:hypothetical protein
MMPTVVKLHRKRFVANSTFAISVNCVTINIRKWLEMMQNHSNVFLLVDCCMTMVQVKKTGAEVLDELAGKDLNKSGLVVNLVICGNSKFYDYSWLEEQLEHWVQKNEYPDLVILGGASGVDFNAERWADNNNIPIAVFREAWATPRPNKSSDTGRPEADTSLAKKMLKRATHMLSFPGPDSVWTKRMEGIARAQGIPVESIPIPVFAE